MIRRALLPGAVLYAGCLAGPASAQYVLAFQDYNAPHIMCKAWERGSNTFLASGEAPNERPSGERFGYYVRTSIMIASASRTSRRISGARGSPARPTRETAQTLIR